MKQLCLIWRTFKTNLISGKKTLCMTLVRSQLWRLKFVKDLLKESNSWLLNTDYASNYTDRLQRLNLLPLGMVLEINVVLFLCDLSKVLCQDSISWTISVSASFLSTLPSINSNVRKRTCGFILPDCLDFRMHYLLLTSLWNTKLLKLSCIYFIL